MKYIGMIFAIYLIINVVVYFYCYTQTKDQVDETISWNGLFNKTCNILIVALLTLPALLYYHIKAVIAKSHVGH